MQSSLSTMHSRRHLPSHPGASTRSSLLEATKTWPSQRWVRMQEARAAERKEPCCTRKIRTIRPIAKVHMQAFFVPLFLAESYSASRSPPQAERRREEKHPDAIDTSTILPRNRRDSADSVKSRLLRDDGSVVEKETLQHVFR